MSKYRRHLPQLRDHLFLTDGGLETTLIFHDGIDLPHFAAFDLLKSDEGFERLRGYYRRYAAIALSRNMGLVLESPTWRANRDWAAKLGYDAVRLADANRRAIGLMLEIRAEFETARSPMPISGNIGPRGDGYRADARMTAEEARAYHRPQIETFAQTDADMVAAFTLTYPEEAIGIVLAARDAGMPVVISFTLETDGRLPSGNSLQAAIERTDAETGGYCAYYANASKRSHAELDDSTDLDAGNPHELGLEYRALSSLLPSVTVVGGCCGTDHRHVEAMCHALQPRQLAVG